ncbi:MAG TPA: hypothetical protein VMR70_03350, partial [Flavisolibacter sp.]|nr:hypothetical protein [Flavisolibacter sp.]
RWAFTVLYVCATVAGVLAVWFSLDDVVRWLMAKRWFAWATDFSFFVYGLHIPLLAFVTNLFFIYLSNFQLYRLFTYLAAPTLVLLFCIGMGALVRRLLPGVYRLATGGRGF